MTHTEEEVLNAVLTLFQQNEGLAIAGVLSGDTYTVRDPLTGRFAGSVNAWDYYHELEREFGAKAASEEFLDTLLE